ncbi:MAG: hypothetical protein QOE83_3 [Actinomycetota bacterium]|nr:hypothetical protein [Actinomycetota bacterium]
MLATQIDHQVRAARTERHGFDCWLPTPITYQYECLAHLQIPSVREHQG